MVSTGLCRHGSRSAEQGERGVDEGAGAPPRALQAREGGGADLVAEPGALALRELAGAEVHLRLGLGAREPAVEQGQRLVVAHRAQALERGPPPRGGERARLLDQTG